MYNWKKKKKANHRIPQNQWFQKVKIFVVTNMKPNHTYHVINKIIKTNVFFLVTIPFHKKNGQPNKLLSKSLFMVIATTTKRPNVYDKAHQKLQSQFSHLLYIPMYELNYFSIQKRITILFEVHNFIQDILLIISK